MKKDKVIGSGVFYIKKTKSKQKARSVGTGEFIHISRRKKNHLKKEKLITVDKNICHGQPCFSGTRIMIYLVLELLEAGISIKDIVSKYYPQITEEHVKAAIGFSSKLIKDQKFIPFEEVK